RIYFYWAILTAAAFVLGAVLLPHGPRHKVHEGTYLLKAGTDTEQSQVFFSEPFELRGRRNIAITFQANVENAGVFLDGELVNAETSDVQPLQAEVAHYQGVEDGEAWSEGEREKTVYLSAQPAGKYSLRLEFEREKTQQPVLATVRVEQGVGRLLNWFLTLL